MAKFQLMAGQHIGKHPTRKVRHAVEGRQNADGSPYVVEIPAEVKWKTGDVLEAHGKDAVAIMQLANHFRQVPDSVPATPINDPVELTDIPPMDYTPVYLDPQLPLPETTQLPYAAAPAPATPAKPSSAATDEMLATVDHMSLDEAKAWSPSVGVNTDKAKTIAQVKEMVKKAKGW